MSVNVLLMKSLTYKTYSKCAKVLPRVHWRDMRHDMRHDMKHNMPCSTSVVRQLTDLLSDGGRFRKSEIRRAFLNCFLITSSDSTAA